MLYKRVYRYIKNKVNIFKEHPFLKVKFKDYLAFILFILLLILIFINKMPLVNFLKDL